MKTDYKYKEADKYVVFNDEDSDLKPVVLELPKPPPYKYIDGYGLEPREQRFERMSIPRRLVDLEAEAVAKVKKELSSNKNNVITLLKIQKKFWELFEKRHKELKKEIEFIRRFYFHRLNGYWFFNNGKPVYITGWHYWYLNVWTMDTDGNTNRPDFRDRDRKEFLFFKYAHETTETFARLDKEGNAIGNGDGTYDMIDMGRRLCFGTIQPKNRRSGNTNKSLAIGMEIVTRTIKTDGSGLQSYSNDNAEEHFKMKLMQGFESFPLWVKPFSTSGRVSDELNFNVGKNEYGTFSLQTKATYATTSSEKFYDGKKLVFILQDEEGKTEKKTCSIAKRWDVTKNCLAQGNGRIIHGYVQKPSTVDEMVDGAFEYRKMANESSFYKRVKATGQTFSGLLRLFVPATEGLDGYIDSYGYSIKDNVLDYQKEELLANNPKAEIQTALQYLQGKRDALLARGDSESMRALREEKKLFPLTYADCFLGESGNIGFNLEIIDKRQADLRREDPTVKGNFEWIAGVFGGEVEFVPDVENGRFTIGEMPLNHVINQKTKITSYDPLRDQYVEMWRPLYPTNYVIGVDTFNFLGKSQSMAGKALPKNNRHSDGGMSVLLKYQQSVDGGKDIREWKTHKFIVSYRNRHGNTDDFNEDVLKCAIYFGGMVFPEMNIGNTYEYFLRHGYGGYMLYSLDQFTGKYKDKAGVHTLEGSKQEIFTLLRDYIENRSHTDVLYDLLQEFKDIRGMEEMRHYDLLASAGVALIGAKSRYAEEFFGESANQSYNIEDYIDLYDM